MLISKLYHDKFPFQIVQSLTAAEVHLPCDPFDPTDDVSGPGVPHGSNGIRGPPGWNRSDPNQGAGINTCNLHLYQLITVIIPVNPQH